MTVRFNAMPLLRSSTVFFHVIAINMQPLWGINTTPRMSFETASAETPLRPVSILNEW